MEQERQPDNSDMQEQLLNSSSPSRSGSTPLPLNPVAGSSHVSDPVANHRSHPPFVPHYIDSSDDLDSPSSVSNSPPVFRNTHCVDGVQQSAATNLPFNSNKPFVNNDNVPATPPRTEPIPVIPIPVNSNDTPSINISPTNNTLHINLPIPLPFMHQPSSPTHQSTALNRNLPDEEPVSVNETQPMPQPQHVPRGRCPDPTCDSL
ncbi:uncharacterized protein LOC102805116, partial [Saccoglossus kowalevskii]